MYDIIDIHDSWGGSFPPPPPPPPIDETLVVYTTDSVIYVLFTELHVDSQLQPISNEGRTKQKRSKKGRASSSGWSMIQSFDIVHTHIRGDNRGRVEITHTLLQ